MRLAILSARATDAHGGCLAEREILGTTLLERQAALCRDLGAEKFIIFVDRMPPGLAAALECLRGEASVTVLRDSRDIAAHLDDVDAAILVRDGVLFSDAIQARLPPRQAEGVFIASYERSPDAGPSDQLIGDGMLSAGLAVYAHENVSDALKEVADWDIELAMPRAMQARSAPHFIPLDPATERHEVANNAAAERWLIQQLPGRHTARALRPILRGLTALRVEPGWFAMAVIACGIFAIPAFLFAMPRAGFVLALLSALTSPLALPLGRITHHGLVSSRLARIRAGHLEFGWLAALAWPFPNVIALAGGLCMLIVLDRRERVLASGQAGGGWPKGAGVLVRTALAALIWLLSGDVVFALAGSCAITLGSIFWRQGARMKGCSAP
ncbi:hypothetical protein ACSMXM_04085 [Pacificimonas sp. ICDLI1SI03]